jgi:oligosaccharide repeat unit polymerase
MALILLLALIPFAFALARGRVDPFEPVFGATFYFLILYFIRPIYDLTIGSDFLGVMPFDAKTMSSFSDGLVIAGIGFIAFLCGYYSVINPFKENTTIYKYYIKSFAPLTIFCIGLLGYVLLIYYLGGLDAYISNKNNSLTTSGQGYLNLLFSFTSSGLALTLLKSSGRMNFTIGLMFCILVSIAYLSGSKSILIAPLFIYFVIYNYKIRRVNFLKLLIFPFIVLLITPIFNDIRVFEGIFSFENLLDSINSIYTNNIIYLKNLMERFYGIDSLTIIIRDTPTIMDFQYGATITPLIYAWIPRFFWEDKPVISFGKIFAETYLSEFFANTGVSASVTIIGESYLNFHILGVVTILFMFGLISNRIYIWLKRSNFNNLQLFIYSQIFFYIVSFWEANIAGYFAERISFIFLQIVIFKLCTKKVKINYECINEKNYFC